MRQDKTQEKLWVVSVLGSSVSSPQILMLEGPQDPPCDLLEGGCCQVKMRSLGWVPTQDG